MMFFWYFLYTSKILVVSLVKTLMYKLVINRYELEASYLTFQNMRTNERMHACDLTLHFA